MIMHHDDITSVTMCMFYNPGISLSVILSHSSQMPPVIPNKYGYRVKSHLESSSSSKVSEHKKPQCTNNHHAESHYTSESKRTEYV